MFRNHYVGNHAHAQRSPHRNDHKLKKLRKSSAQSSRFSRRIESGFPLRAKRSVEATQFYPKAKGVGGGTGAGAVFLLDRANHVVHRHVTHCDSIPPPDFELRLTFERAPASHNHRTRNTDGRYGRVARSTNLPAVCTVGTPPTPTRVRCEMVSCSAGHAYR